MQPVVEKKAPLGQWTAAMAVILVLGACLFPVFAQNHVVSYRSQCISNLKQIGMGQILYAADDDDRFPLGETWGDAIYPYTKNERVLNCPVAGVFGYAMNRQLSGFRCSQWKHNEAAKVVLLFESREIGRNVATDLRVVAPPTRHAGRYNVAYADAHAKNLPVPKS